MAITTSPSLQRAIFSPFFLHSFATRTGYDSFELAQKQILAKVVTFPWGQTPHEARRQTMATLAETMASEKEVIQKKDTASSGRVLWRPNIDFKWIRDNKTPVAINIINRKAIADVESVVQLYERTCQIRGEVDKLRAERNTVANAMKGKLEVSRRQELIEQGKQLKERLAGLEDQLTNALDLLYQEGRRIPNTTHPNAPVGSEENAVLRKQVGAQRAFSFRVRDHVELGLALDLFDFEAAAEVSGNKFYYLKNEAVLLELALINWSIAQLTRKGFIPLSTPDLVRSNVVEKCGFQPRGPNTQIYSVEAADLCLAGTSEIPVGGLYMDQIISKSTLPLKFAAFSHCFRTEAGAAGSATRGLYRVHQFSKVEMFVICCPEDSEAFHEELVSIEEELFGALGLHFKVLDMATEDLGSPAYRKFDIEAWMPGMDRYGEISSASNCTDYQSRRLNIRYRPVGEMPAEKGRSNLQFVHTLNGTACAIPRMLISILENYQQEDGSVVIPKVLQPYMAGVDVIRPKNN